jgi:type II secretory pathway component PulM
MPRTEITLRRDEPEAGADAKAALGVALAKEVARKRKEHLRLGLLIGGGALFLGIVWLLLWKLVYSIDTSVQNLKTNLNQHNAQGADKGEEAN